MSDCKPQEALQLGLNVLIDSNCEGEHCHFHEFPYKTKNILSNGLKKQVEFDNKADVWEYVNLLCEESEMSQRGNKFSTLNNVWEQLPFFVCTNKILNEECQNDISKYIYCKDTGTPPYSGAYGDTPSKWIAKYYIIKQAIMLKEQKSRDKAQDGNK